MPEPKVEAFKVISSVLKWLDVGGLKVLYRMYPIILLSDNVCPRGGNHDTTTSFLQNDKLSNGRKSLKNVSNYVAAR